jgi:very-short-patch-repair endonuclease
MVFYCKGAKMVKNYLKRELDIFLKLPRMVQEMIWSDFSAGEIQSEYLTTVYDFDNYSECESPIEVILNYAFDRLVWVSKENEELRKYAYHVMPQEIIETSNHNYRVDFLIQCYISGRDDEQCSEVIVECDGHEFHEKTKAQVKRRNDRDYDLKMAGYDVLHFSGSEIYNNPAECALKILKYLWKEVK